MPTDWFPDADRGQCINWDDAFIITFRAGGSIEKGWPVKFSDKNVWPPEVVKSVEERAIGVALMPAKAAGDLIPVAVDNALVKVKIAFPLACGTALKPYEYGEFMAASDDYFIAIGILMQKTTANHDEAIMLVKASFLGVG